MTEQIDMAVRLRAIAAAQGKEPFDLLLTGGRVLDVATLELREADVGIVGPMIASVHPRGLFADARTTDDLRDQILAPDRVLSIDGYVFWPKLTPGTLQASMQGDFSAWQLVNGSQLGRQLWDCHSTHHQFTLTPLSGAPRRRRQP